MVIVLYIDKRDGTMADKGFCARFKIISDNVWISQHHYQAFKAVRGVKICNFDGQR